MTRTIDPGRFTRRGMLRGSLATALLFAHGQRVHATPVAGTPVGDAFPVTLAHAAGEATIPARPQRVVAASDFIDLDYLLSLHVQPVLYGFSNAWESGVMPWQSAAEGVPTFDASGDPDFEAIAAAQPDLIVTMPLYVENGYDILSEIAPTIVLDWSTLWRDGLRLVARAVGRSPEAEASIRETERLIAAVKQQLEPISNKRLMVGFEYFDSFFIWGTEGGGPQFFRELGLNVLGGPDPILAEISLEQLDLLKPAEILLSVASDPAGIAAQEENPLFRALPAVQEGGYGVLSVIEARAVSDGLSPISIAWGLPTFVKLLETLAAGKGKRLA